MMNSNNFIHAIHLLLSYDQVNTDRYVNCKYNCHKSSLRSSPVTFMAFIRLRDLLRVNLSTLLINRASFRIFILIHYHAAA